MVEVDLAKVARFERAMLTSWPALSTAFDGDWVIRLADGVTKRSNSVTCLTADDADLASRIDHVQAIFENRGLPAIFRLSPLASPALDSTLAKRGWHHVDETIVMSADLDDIDVQLGGHRGHDVIIKARPDQPWLQTCYQINQANAAHLAALTTMLDRLIPPAGYGRVGQGERIDALALVVVDAELTGLFEVLTIKEQRRQGLARKLLCELFSWSRAQGATTAWLAVVAANLPAVRLYQSLGFQEVYRYHYRSSGC